MNPWLGLIFILLALPPAQAAAQESPLFFQRSVLPNGLIVLAVQDNSSATAALHIAVRYDPQSLMSPQAGIAALSQQIAHYQMTELLQQEAAFQPLAEQLNGTRGFLALNTEMDYCELRGKITDELLPVALQLAGKILFAPPEATAEQLDKARAALIQEKKEVATAIIENTYYCFARALYGRQSPLARDVAGSPETIRALSEADIADFRRAYMRPNNAILCLIAPRSPAEMIQLVSSACGEYPAGGQQAGALRPAFSSESRVCVAQQPGWRGASMMIGAPAPPYGTREFLAAQLIYALWTGPEGRLNQDSALQRSLKANRVLQAGQEAPSVNVLPPLPQPGPCLILHVIVRPSQMEQARQELLKHFLLLQQEPPSAAEWQRAQQRLINAYAQLFLDRPELAKSLACYEIYGGDLNIFWQAEKIIQSMTPEEISALAQRYFNIHAIGVLLPGDEESQ